MQRKVGSTPVAPSVARPGEPSSPRRAQVPWGEVLSGKRVIRYAMVVSVLAAAAVGATFAVGTGSSSRRDAPPVSVALVGKAVTMPGAVRSGGSGWAAYVGSDAPEGAQLGYLKGPTDSISGTVPLGKTLPAGKYFVSVKEATSHK